MIFFFRAVGAEDLPFARAQPPQDGFSLRGAQVGLANIVGQMQGVQVGLINRAEDLNGFQIGIVNVIRNAEMAFCPILNVGF